MEQEKYEALVENLCLVVPLMQKKFVRYDLHDEHIDLNPPHFHILFTLEEMGKLTVTEIGKALTITKTNVTPLIQKLIDKHFVERIYDETDRRYIRINLTAEGKEFLGKIKVLIINDLKSKISNFNEADLQKLSDTVQSLKDLLNKIE